MSLTFKYTTLDNSNQFSIFLSNTSVDIVTKYVRNIILKGNCIHVIMAVDGHYILEHQELAKNMLDNNSGKFNNPELIKKTKFDYSRTISTVKKNYCDKFNKLKISKSKHIAILRYVISFTKNKLRMVINNCYIA